MMSRLPSWDEFLNPSLNPRIATKGATSRWSTVLANGLLAEQPVFDPLWRRSARASFLDRGVKDLATAHAAVNAATDPTPGSSHVDFLFGGHQSPELVRFSALASPDTIDLKTAMMFGTPAPTRPGRDDDEECRAQEKETGFFRIVPRGLNMFAAADVVSLLVVLATRHMDCDVPLATWLAGGVVMGFPVSCLVHSIASAKPKFSQYRLDCSSLRGGGEPDGMAIDGLQLLGRLGSGVSQQCVQGPEGDGSRWAVRFDSPELVAAYRIVTGAAGSTATDPASWVFEASNDGTSWTRLDEATGQELPRSRGTASEIFDELFHTEASRSFRGAFLVEVAAVAAAFAWLVAGTSWVGAGSETCVDSAPMLWYTCYLIVVSAWSLLGTVTIGLIVCAVAMVVLGVKAQST